jgi:predicted nucleic acid-binding protein
MPGMSKEHLIIVDADALISFVYVDDQNHPRAKEIMRRLARMHVNMLFPTTAVCEAVTVLRGKLNNPEDAKQVVKQFQNKDFPLYAVDPEILRSAAELFNPSGSKKNTLFDAVVAATAKSLNADAVFSFDEWYRKIGLRLASDLVMQPGEAA